MVLEQKSPPVPALALLFVVRFLGSTLIHGSALGFASSAATSQYIEVASTTRGGILVSVVVSGLRQLRPEQRVTPAILVDILVRLGSLVALLVSPIVFCGISRPRFRTASSGSRC